MPSYQGKKVTIVRPAKQGDQGFDQNKDDQIVISMPDGTEKTVPREEVTQQE